MDIAYVSGLTLDGFKDMSRTLSRDTILLILSVLEDAEGRKLVSRDAVAAITVEASAPAYTVYSSYIGAGVLGGYMQTFESMGEAMAELAAEVVTGVASAPRIVEPESYPTVDWRQMRRWGMDASLLADDTERLFYEPTVWEEYRLHILAAAAVILLQAATIATMIVQARRRRRIEEELALERLELAHLSRTSQLGELSGALAHELSQPLASILANAEAGVKLLERTSPDTKELERIPGRRNRLGIPVWRGM
ncbi:MAG: hypothetical protein AB7P52_09085 [Alphaproteobacteria bacterium]